MPARSYRHPPVLTAPLMKPGGEKAPFVLQLCTPTLGTINILALSDAHCMQVSLALTPTAQRNNELLKKYRKNSGDKRGGERARRRLTNSIQNRAAIDRSSVTSAGQSEGCLSCSEVSGASGRICAHVLLLRSYCSPCCRLAWNAARFYVGLRTGRVKSIKLSVFFSVNGGTTGHCDQL